MLRPLVMPALAKDPRQRPAAAGLLDLLADPAARHDRPGPGGAGLHLDFRRAPHGGIPPVRAGRYGSARRPSAGVRANPPQPPENPDRRLGRGGSRDRRPGVRAADGPRHRHRPAGREPVRARGHHRGRPGHLPRPAATRRLPGHQPRRGLRRHDRRPGVAGQRRRGPPGVLRVLRRRPDVAGRPAARGRRRDPARARADAAGRRRRGMAGDRPGCHLDQPGRYVLDARVDPRHHPAAARRRGVGDHQDRRQASWPRAREVPPAAARRR